MLFLSSLIAPNQYLFLYLSLRNYLQERFGLLEAFMNSFKATRKMSNHARKRVTFESRFRAEILRFIEIHSQVLPIISVLAL